MVKSGLRNNEVIDSGIATDRALLYGDAVFTTIAVRDGQVLFPERHIQRLSADSSALGFENVSVERIKNTILSASKDIDSGILRVAVSRSSGTRGYLCQQPEPVYWATTDAWPAHIDHHCQQGIRLTVCEQRLSRNKSLAGIKHCNKLEQVLARNEWQTDTYQEGIMLDTRDKVIEGTMSNLFMVKDGQLFTPDLEFSGVNGIIRTLIIEMSRDLGIPLTVCTMDLTTLKSADAIFVTNSVIGIWPVNQLDAQQYQSHSIIGKLQDELARRQASSQK